jgi:uncharacterized protein
MSLDLAPLHAALVGSDASKPSWPSALDGSGQMQIGRVVCISGSEIVAVISRDLCSANASHELRKGGMIKLMAEDRAVYGAVAGLSISNPDLKGSDDDVLLAEIELVGEAFLGTDSEMRRGCTIQPALGEPLFAITEDDIRIIYSANRRQMIPVGLLHDSPRQKAMLYTDGLLGKHFAVLGTTGSGKSCAVALILQRVLEQNSKAHIVLLDPHNEYASAFKGQAELLSPANLELPYWMLTGEELSEVVCGSKRGSEHAVEAITILSELVPLARKAFYRTTNPGATSDVHISIDTPTPFSMREIYRMLDEQMGRLEKSQPVGPYRWLRSRLDTLRADSRFSFMFGGLTVRDSMAETLSRLLRMPVDGKPITVVDLSGVPSEVLNVVVSVLSRMAFDFGLWSRGAEPVLLVCEEAHRYCPADDSQGFEPTKEILARIAKEGRKYGVSLAIVSQRPSDIAPGILSQCNTTVAMRMTSTKDQDIVRGMMADSAFGLLDFLPSLSNGEAIIAGEAVTVPQRVRFDMLEDDKRPHSATAAFAEAWNAESKTLDYVQQIVERWRKQSR